MVNIYNIFEALHLLPEEEYQRKKIVGSFVSHRATFFLPPNDQTCAGVIVMDRVAPEMH